MAQALVMFRFPRPADVLWWTCWIPTILVFYICCCGALSGQDRAPQHDGSNRPHICETDGWCESPDSALLSLSLNETDSEILAIPSRLRSRASPGRFEGREGPFSASKGNLGSQRAWISGPRSVYGARRTICNEVYYASVSLSLAISSLELDTARRGQRRHLSMANIPIAGVFSNRTDRFCAKFCLGDDPRSMAPTRLAYVLEHPESPTVPDTLVARDCEVHIVVEFPKTKTIANPFVSGVITSLRSPDDPSYFHPLIISAISHAPYEFNKSVQNEAQVLGASVMSDISPGVHRDLKVWSQGPPFCATDGTRALNYILPVWNSSCEGQGLCSPFQSIKNSRIVRSGAMMSNIHCTRDWRISAAFLFDFTQERTDLPEVKSNESDSSTATTEVVLMAEGYWNFYKPGQLVMVAHYLASDGTPLDSQILITLQIPMARTLYHRYGIIGHVRSSREASDPLYFSSFRLVGDIRWSTMRLSDVFRDTRFPREQQLSYDYDDGIKSKIQPVCSLAAAGASNFHKNAKFPDGSRASDLEVPFRFAMPGLANSSKYFLSNLAIGQEFHHRSVPVHGSKNNNEDSTVHPSRYRFRVPSVSFTLNTFRLRNEPVLVPMEGFYDSNTGQLCLLGCRRTWEDVALSYEKDDTEDGTSQCDLVFSIQYPPTNPRLWAKHPVVTGTITSLHDAGHPLYFEPLAINSSVPTVYGVHTRWTLLQRNAETIMSLASLSLVTFFTAVRVRFSSRESSSRNVAFVSLVMLTVLTSGHFLPLLLSFNAFWTKIVPQTQMQDFYEFGGWPEAHEVIVRGTSMVALLLELRLLQLVWRSRTRADNSTPQIGTESSAPSKVSDFSVFRACLPMYGLGLVVVACVHWQLGPHQQQVHYINQDRVLGLVWADLQAFSGVILDLFLLPQVIANVSWDTEEKVAPLYPLFYVGMTVVRSVAHLFDAARAWKFVPELHINDYYYANPNWDLYSTTWDIVIPCASAFLAVVLLLQQRYGGRCFIPKRLLRRPKYQLVELQHGDL